MFLMHQTISEGGTSVQASDGFRVSFITSPPVSQRPKATAMNPPVVEFTTHQGDL